MGEFLRVVLDSISYLWPFRLVHSWERGGYYVCGRFWREVRPGCWPVVPWFTEVRTLSAVPGVVSTPRIDVTLSDGTPISFAVTANVRVTNYNAAMNTIDNHHQSAQELLEAVCAEKVAEVDAGRLEPKKRRALLTDLRRWVTEATGEFGVEVTNVRFKTFILRARTIRLLTESNPAAW